MLTKERNNRRMQIRESRHVVPREMFPVIVMPSIESNDSAAKEAAELFEGTETALALHNHKRGLHLPSQRHHTVPKDWAAKAAFPVHETDNPSYGPESFLLVLRTSHVVTAVHSNTPSTSMYRCTDGE